MNEFPLITAYTLCSIAIAWDTIVGEGRHPCRPRLDADPRFIMARFFRMMTSRVFFALRNMASRFVIGTHLYIGSFSAPQQAENYHKDNGFFSKKQASGN